MVEGRSEGTKEYTKEGRKERREGYMKEGRKAGRKKRLFIPQF